MRVKIVKIFYHSRSKQGRLGAYKLGPNSVFNMTSSSHLRSSSFFEHHQFEVDFILGLYTISLSSFLRSHLFLRGGGVFIIEVFLIFEVVFMTWDDVFNTLAIL